MGFAGETIWRFLREGGAGVIITDVQDELGKISNESIKRKGYKSFYSHLDVTVESDWEKVIEKTLSEFGRIDYLVNIAGIMDSESIEKTSTEKWQNVIDITQRGTFLGTRSIIQAMKKTGGSIVNVSSMAALSGSETYGAAYSASRSSLLNFTKSSALQLSKYGIRVNTILPGWTRTPFTEHLYLNEKHKRSRENQIPLGRWGEPSEIAAGILFFLSDDASYITGSSIVIDGGVTATQFQLTNQDNM
jgi:NAD(P)-dependent dehydrogenase (short-subunit alcohol dehydrogenase family)